MEDEDPFSCFGDDDDSVDEIENQTNVVGVSSTTLNDECSHSRRRQLIEEANNRFIHNNENGEQSNNIPQKHLETETEEEELSSINIIPSSIIDEVWKNRPPVYKNPKMVVVTKLDGIGGGRGYIATENLTPGTLLLVEKPLLEWPSEQIGFELGLVSIEKGILLPSNHNHAQQQQQQQHVQSILQDLDNLHPTKMAVDRIFRETNNNNKTTNNHPHSEQGDDTIQILEMIQELLQLYNDNPQLERILQIIKEQNITTMSSYNNDNNNNNVRLLDKIDVMRLLLALRYNGFTSGVYLHYAIFNHSDDNPNCIKFLPQTTDTPSTSETQTYSEVWTTQHVRKGQELTLHYLNPREVSHATRRWHLWDQHRFDIGPSMSTSSSIQTNIKNMEIVQECFPTSSFQSINKQSDTYLAEQAVTQLEELCQEMKLPFIHLAESNNTKTEIMTFDSSQKEVIVETFERAKALELAAQELIHATIRKLKNPHHIILIRCYRLHLDASELLLRTSSTENLLLDESGSSLIQLTKSQQMNIMCRFLPNARKLLSLQIQLLGSDHIDLARTYQDISQSIITLLSVAPKRLMGLGLDGLKTFHQCSMEENRCRKEFERLSALYPRDIDKFLNKK